MTEKQRRQVKKSELNTRLPGDVASLLLAVDEEELDKTKSHSSNHVRFVEVAHKLFKRIEKEKLRHQTRLQDAKVGLVAQYHRLTLRKAP